MLAKVEQENNYNLYFRFRHVGSLSAETEISLRRGSFSISEVNVEATEDAVICVDMTIFNLIL